MRRRCWQSVRRLPTVCWRFEASFRGMKRLVPERGRACPNDHALPGATRSDGISASRPPVRAGWRPARSRSGPPGSGPARRPPASRRAAPGVAPLRRRARSCRHPPSRARHAARSPPSPGRRSPRWSRSGRPGAAAAADGSPVARPRSLQFSLLLVPSAGPSGTRTRAPAAKPLSGTWLTNGTS